MTCRICNEKELITTYEGKSGICLECQDEVAQYEAKILLQRKFFAGEEWNLRKFRECLAGKRYILL